MKYLLPFLALISCAQAPKKLTDKAKDIEVVSNKPINCSVVGKVVGSDKMGSKELALNDALNQAASLGASSLHVNQEVPNGKNISVYATAYDCN